MIGSRFSSLFYQLAMFSVKTVVRCSTIRILSLLQSIGQTTESRATCFPVVEKGTTLYCHKVTFILQKRLTDLSIMALNSVVAPDP